MSPAPSIEKPRNASPSTPCTLKPVVESIRDSFTMPAVDDEDDDCSGEIAHRSSSATTSEKHKKTSRSSQSSSPLRHIDTRSRNIHQNTHQKQQGIRLIPIYDTCTCVHPHHRNHRYKYQK